MSPNRGDGKKTTFSLLPQATVRPAEATPPLCCPERYCSHGWRMGDSRRDGGQQASEGAVRPRGGSDPLPARPARALSHHHKALPCLLTNGSSIGNNKTVSEVL